MNSQQLEFKLDKRIRLFENHLNYQMVVMEMSNIFFTDDKDVFPMMAKCAFKFKQLNFNMAMIVSQTMPKFKSGCYLGVDIGTDEGCAYVQIGKDEVTELSKEQFDYLNKKPKYEPIINIDFKYDKIKDLINSNKLKL